MSYGPNTSKKLARLWLLAPLGLVPKQIRFSGFQPESVERTSVERRSAFEAATLYALTLHALRALAGHNVRITPKVWKLFLHELLVHRIQAIAHGQSKFMRRIRLLEFGERGFLA